MAFLGPELTTSDLLNWDGTLSFLGSDLPPLCDLPIGNLFPSDALPEVTSQPLSIAMTISPPSSPDSAFPASPQHSTSSGTTVVTGMANLTQFMKTEQDLSGMASGGSDGEGYSTKWARTDSCGGTPFDSRSVEEQSAKKQRRMLKNRESAHLSRKRKKEYVETLEKQVADSTQDRESMVSRIALLESENQRLRQELDEYRAGRKPHSPVATAAATTTCVLAFLALFSLFVSPTATPALPTPTRALAPLGLARTLQTTDVAASQGMLVRVPAPVRETHVDDMEAWRQLQRAKLLDSQTETTSTDVTVPSHEQNSTLLPVFRLSADYNAAMLHSLQRRPDTAYVLCTEVRVLSAAAPSDTPRLSVIMPAPRLQAPSKNATVLTRDAVQIDCDILQSTPLSVNNNSTAQMRVPV